MTLPKTETWTLDQLSWEDVREVVRSEAGADAFSSVGDQFSDRPNYHTFEEEEGTIRVVVGGDYQSLGLALLVAGFLDWTLVPIINLFLSEPVSVRENILAEGSQELRIDLHKKEDGVVQCSHSRELSQQKGALSNALKRRNEKQKSARTAREIFRHLHEVDPETLDDVPVVEAHRAMVERFEVLEEAGNFVGNPEVDRAFLEDPESFTDPEDVWKLVDQAKQLEKTGIGKMRERFNISYELALTNQGLNQLIRSKKPALKQREETLRHRRRRETLSENLPLTSDQLEEYDERTAVIRLICQECDHEWQPSAETLISVLKQTLDSPKKAEDTQGAGLVSLFAAVSGDAERVEESLAHVSHATRRAKKDLGLRCPECTSGRIQRVAVDGNGEKLHAFPVLGPSF